MSGHESESGPVGPAIEIHGPATAEDVAAVVAVLMAAGGDDDGSGGGRGPRSGWTARDRALRPSLPHGRGAWRASGRP